MTGGNDTSAGSESAARWPAPGDRMRFLGANGYPDQLKRALKTFEVGAEYEVEACDVGDWSHSIRVKGVDGWHNGVMFERVLVPTPAQGSLNREQMLERAISEACDLLAERTYGNAARSPGHNARLRLEQALVAQVYAAQPPAAPVEQDEMLSRLVDWAYLHALEGAAWPSTKTKQMLIARARQDKPTQDHADGMKAVAPRSSADNIERWIDQNFSGHGRALRTLQEPPIDGEPFMSMEDAKQLLRDGIAKFCHPPQTPSVPSGEIEALAAHLEGHPSSWDADKIRRAASYLRGRSFRPCPGCDGYECKNECMYPGVAAVTRPHQRGGS
jgi:hypothetical protein